MEPDSGTQYAPITIKLGVIILWGLFAPQDYPERLKGFQTKIMAYPSKNGEIPPSEKAPVMLRLNGEELPKGIMATSNFFMDVEYLKEAGKITRIRQINGHLMIAEKYSMSAN